MPKENTKKCIFAAKNTANMHFLCIKHNQFVLLFMAMGFMTVWLSKIELFAYARGSCLKLKLK